jgi:hypothetical protein
MSSLEFELCSIKSHFLQDPGYSLDTPNRSTVYVSRRATIGHKPVLATAEEVELFDQHLGDSGSCLP